MRNKKTQTGQVLLLVLLAMAVLATVALSVVSRSISEVGVTTREEESLRAFSAAEAGIEQGLITGTLEEVATNSVEPITEELSVPAPAGSTTVGTFTAEVKRYPQNLREFAYPYELYSGQSGTVSFVTRNDSGGIVSCGSAPCFTGNTIRLCWGNPSNTAQTPAVLVNIIYDDGGYAVASAGYDPDSSRRQIGVGGAPANLMSAPTGGNCTIAGQAYSYYADINFATLGISGTPIIMRVTTLYNNTEPHIFGVSTASDLPVQGRRVTSEGSAGEVTRRIDVFSLNPEVPFIFDAALYSDGDIIK